MLKVGALTESQSTSIFQNSDSINVVPVVSAEWNHNLFNPPYITTAGTGSTLAGTLTSGTVSDVTVGGKDNFTTKSFTMSGGTGSVSYTVSGLSSIPYKVITYVKTNNPMPVMVNAYGKGSASQFGSEQVEASSLGWTKIVTYISAPKASESSNSFVYKIVANRFSEETDNSIVYFTLPEIYETTPFDYKNGSLFPTDSPFTYFRPGESYVSSGDSKCSFGLRYRRVASKVLSSETSTIISDKEFFGNKYMPLTPIIQNPSFFLSSPPVAVLKNALPTDINPYKYFVSDSSSKSITAIYEKDILTNKIVIKVNTLMTVPTLNLYINESLVTVDSSTSITPVANADGYVNGLIVLYWTGSAWTKTPWTTMPQFDSVGALNTTTTINKIRLTQISRSVNTPFSSYSGSSVTDDLNRMHIIEISPRLEVDLSDFVQDVSISKSLDSGNTVLPISSINSNDAKITFSGIPSIKNGSIVPIFSSQSNNSLTVLSNMLRKNIKFYVNFNLRQYASAGSAVTENSYVPGGVFYSDSWEENDIQEVSVQTYDISRYLQSRPVPDYVANLKTVFQVITNILDLAGFTDYDYDSLHKICNNKAQPLDIAYYYCNSKDTTLIDALNQMFVAYQIGAYIDEYGVMKFLGLYDILTNTSAGLSISEANISQGGLSVSNTEKPGKVSLRYQTPKVKQSPSLQNVTDIDIKNSPAFIYTTSNDVVWQQQTIDSVGFNYIDNDMNEDSNTLSINSNDLLDIFHTFNMDTKGYVAVEKEIVSFEYKQYTISNKSKTKSITVSIKNNLELASYINKFIKEYSIGLQTSDGSIGQNYDYDILVEPTGNITNVERGMFGTVPADHKRIASLASKGLSEKSINSSFVFSASAGNTSITNNSSYSTVLPNVTKLGLKASGTNKTAVCQSSETTNSYKTYSVKFDIPDQNVVAAGLYINQSSSGSSVPLFVELIRYSRYKPDGITFFDPPIYSYIMAIYDSTQTYAYTDVTGECNNILKTLPRVLKATGDTLPDPAYTYFTDKIFNLRVVLNSTDGSDGENGTVGNLNTAVYAYLNNTEINGWQIPDTSGSVSDWKQTSINTTTGIRQKPTVPDLYTESKSFGFYTSVSPVEIENVSYPTPTVLTSNANLREIHATEKPLFERSAGYFYQDREFLNGLVQKQPLYSNSETYMMQTTPEISGINYYDVQYSTPAAVSVDVLPIQYMMSYFPGNTRDQQQYKQKKLVTEDSLSYSTPLNTGFRARMAIANSSPHMVLLTKESDEVVRVTVNLNLWTHEIVAPSDPEILEAIIDPSNMSEVVQLDSEWIQSKSAAAKLLKIVEMGIDGFSTTISLDVFGNPLIQVGDIITLSYNLNGIVSQRNIVTSVSHSFNSGLSTRLTLKRLN